MSLIKCPECSKGISEKALMCPNCGYQMKEILPGWIRGWGFEWRTKAELFGLPLVHIAVGRNPKTGRLRVAKGIIAIGQFAFGFVTLAQFGVGLLFGIGQFLLGLVVVAQFAGAVLLGLGQFATGHTAVGQFAFGKYARGQAAVGEHVITRNTVDVEAIRHFEKLKKLFRMKKEPTRD